MKAAFLVFASVLLLGVAPISHADPDRDESGHGRYEHRKHKGGEYKEEFRDGNCKVERKWERNGKYKEERKCEEPRHHSRGPHDDHYPSSAGEPAVIIHLPTVVVR